MKCRLNHSSTPAIIFRVGGSLATTIEMHRRPFVFVVAKRRRVVTSAETATNVGITTRGGFIIPANDLTKRTRRPGMGRVESRSPLSRGRLVVSLAFPGEELFSHLYSAVQSTLAPSCGPRIYIRHKPLETSLDGRRGHRDLPRQWCTTFSRTAREINADHSTIEFRNFLEDCT